MDHDEEADDGGDGVLWITMKRLMMVVTVLLALHGCCCCVFASVYFTEHGVCLSVDAFLFCFQ